MANPTVYGKVDCYSESLTGIATVDLIRTSQEIYVGLFNFLEYLETQGETELITYYSGSGGLGTGKDYWNTANMAGSNSFSVWKIKSNVERDWDWYLYIHGMNGTGSMISTSNSTPSRTAAGTSFTNESVVLSMQAAMSVSGALSANPWNGTISLSGAAYKSSPVWVTGAQDYKLFVLPRANNVSGAYNTTKELQATIFHAGYFSTTLRANDRARYHYFFDGHGFLFSINHSVSNSLLSGSYYTSYVGPFTLMDSITTTNTGSNDLLGEGGNLGFVMLTSTDQTSGNLFTQPPAHTFFEYSSYGSTTPAAATPEGGVLVTKTVGVRTAMLANDNAFHTTTYSPNPFAGNSYDERIYSVLSNEANHAGFAGIITSPLLRCIVGLPSSHDVSATGLRAVLAANTTATNRKITVPWTSSLGAPGTNLTRVGITFSIPNYTF